MSEKTKTDPWWAYAVIVLLLLVGGYIVWLSSSRGTSSTSTLFRGCSTLTTQCAQATIDKWVARQGRPENRNNLQIVGGVRDLPSENAAVAEVNFIDFSYTATQKPGRVFKYNGRGIAVFSNYTDGKWSLTKVQTGEQFNETTWSPNLPVD